MRIIAKNGFRFNLVVQTLLTLSLVGSLLTVSPARADEKSIVEEILGILKTRGQITDAQYEELMAKARKEKMKEAEETVEAKDMEEPEKKATGGALQSFWDHGVNFVSPDKQLAIKFGGSVMLDWGFVDADDPFNRGIEAAEGDTLDGEGVEFRRARLYVSGTLYDSVVFKAQYDFAGGDSTFKDMYLGLKDVPAVGHILVGHFKEPFSLEEQTSGKYTTFMERSLPNSFSPGRNTGVMIYDAALGGRLHWALGGFYNADDFGDGFNDATDVNITARLTGAPITADEGREALHLGVSYSRQMRDEADPASLVRYRERPETHITDARLVDTGGIPADGVDLVDLEAAFVWGPFSMQGEYMTAFVDSGAAGDPEFRGFYVYASYFLTGESRPYKPEAGTFSRVKPRTNFHPAQGGLGAWEVALRYSRLDLTDESIRGGEMSDVTFGLNWYLNPSVRFMFNYVNSDLDDRAAAPDGDVDSFMSRFQFEF